MKRTTLCLLLVIMLVFLFAGCKEKINYETTNLRLVLASNQFTKERQLAPEHEGMTISSYLISGIGPDGQTFSKECSEHIVDIGNLMIGRWSLTAKGLNENGTELVSGELTTMLSKVSKTATIHLDTLVGEGTLQANIQWNPKQVAADVRLEVTLLNQENNPIPFTVPELDTNAGTVILQTNLPSGSYLLQLRLFSEGVVVSGATEAIRILDQKTSSGDLSMIIGDLSTQFEITIVNDTMLPIEGSITATPAVPSAGQTVVFTYEPTNLPENISPNDISVDWYCEGECMQQSSATYSCIPLAGTHRYDAIVRHEKQGSIGNTTLLVTMPY